MDKMSIMNYLPQEERVKLMNLIKKLGEENQQKLKYKALYEKSIQDYHGLKQKYQKLEHHNKELKSQISTSRLAISKAKQAFMASKSAGKTKRRSQSPIDDQEEQVRKLKYEFQNQHDDKQWRHKTNEVNPVYIPKPPRQSERSTPYKTLPPKINNNKSQSSFINRSNSSKKQQLLNLKQEIKELANSMTKKKKPEVSLAEKMKLTEQIRRQLGKNNNTNKKVVINKSERSEEQGDQHLNGEHSLSSYSHSEHQKYYKNEKQYKYTNNNQNKINQPQLQNSVHKGQSSSQSFIKQSPYSKFQDYENQQNSSKQDIHPNTSYHQNINLKKSNRSKISNNQTEGREINQFPVDNFGKNSINSSKKKSNLYDDSFFDLVKQLNQQ